MTSRTSGLDQRAALRRAVAHEVYQRLAFTSFVIWTVGTFLLFVAFAAGTPKPVPPAG